MQRCSVSLACDVKRHVMSWCNCCWTNGLDHGRTAVFQVAYTRRVVQIRRRVDVLRVQPVKQLVVVRVHLLIPRVASPA